MVALTNLKDLIDEAVDKILDKYDWDSIEFLFRPTNHLELFLRLNYDGTVEWLKELGYYYHVDAIKQAVKIEYMYRLLVKEHEKRQSNDVED